MADWDRLLTFVITPKSGPWRKMVDLMTSGKPLSPEFDAMVAALEEEGWLPPGASPGARSLSPEEIKSITAKRS